VIITKTQANINTRNRSLTNLRQSFHSRSLLPAENKHTKLSWK